ncbi:MAG: tetratricopeptide repeat protein [Saprospiraceae bacterium]|nr:tetratricopeptide repeat protein [Saprospiraceae bacterium]
MIRLSPLLLLIWMSTTVMAQKALTTKSGWHYEIVQRGHGPLLDTNKGIETHNQLVDADKNVLVSTYAVGIPDYQLVKDLSPPFQAACNVMKAGGHYKFYIPIDDFRATIKGGAKLKLPGDHVVWEVELLRVLPPLPDIAGHVKATIKRGGIDAAFNEFKRLSASPDSGVYFGEWEVNEIGYLFLNNDKSDEAVVVFDYNAKKHPQSANAHDSLAEAYHKAGKKEMAIKHYRWSLELNPNNANARKMLSKIE